MDSNAAFYFFGVILNLNTKTYLKVAFITFTSVVIFFLQAYMFPSAGKTNISKLSEYSFQMNFWSEKIYDKFDLIKYSDSYKNLSLYTGQKTVSAKFFDDIDEYHYQITAMLRILKRHAGVAVNVMNDAQPMLAKASYEIGLDKLKLINENYKKFEINMGQYDKRIAEIENYLPALKKAFANREDKLSESEQVELSVKQIDLLQSLYTNENLFVKHDPDPFKFVRDFAINSERILADYRLINEVYNNVVVGEQDVKNSLIFFFLLIAAYFTFRKESQD